MAPLLGFLRCHARPFLLACIAVVMFGLWFGVLVRTMSPQPLVTIRAEAATDDIHMEFSQAGDKLFACPYRERIHVSWPTPSYRGPVQVWDIPSGRPRGTMLKWDDGVWWAELSPDGDHLAVLDGPLKLTVLQLSTGETFTEDCFKDWGGGFNVWPSGYRCFSGDGRLLACSAYGRRDARAGIVVWDLVQQREVLRLEGHTGPFAFSPDGRLLATCKRSDSGSWDNPITLWDIATSKAVATFLLRADYITRIVFSPDGKHLAVGGGAVGDSQRGDDIDVAVWNLETGQLAGSFLGLTSVEALEDELRVSARWVERPLASEPHSRRLPVEPYFELLSAFRPSDAPSPGRWHIEQRYGEHWLDDFWELAGDMFDDDVPNRARFRVQTIIRDSLTDEAVLTLRGTSPIQISPDGRRLTMMSEDGIRIWDLPPRRPVGLLLGLAAVPALLFTALVWWRLR